MIGEDEEEIPPELAHYEPISERPRRQRVRGAARLVVVFLLITGLVLPGVLIGVNTASRTAIVACRIVAAGLTHSEALEPTARFELAGQAGPGWYCYLGDSGGKETLVRFLGLIPEVRRGSTIPVENV